MWNFSWKKFAKTQRFCTLWLLTTLISREKLENFSRLTLALILKGDSGNGLFDCKVLSRQHAMIIYEDERFFILDTGSSNGTFVNNIRLSKTGEESKMTEIFNGDIIRFGSDIVDKVNSTPITVNLSLKCLWKLSSLDKRKNIIKLQCLFWFDNVTEEFSRENVKFISYLIFSRQIATFVLNFVQFWIFSVFQRSRDQFPLFWLVKAKNARDFFMLWAKLRPLANWFWLVKTQNYCFVYNSGKIERRIFHIFVNPEFVWIFGEKWRKRGKR